MKKLFTLVFAFSCYVASSQIIYVNTLTGQDSNNGLAQTQGSGNSGPKKTISGQFGGFSALTGGEILSVAAGNYNEHVIIDKSVQLIKTGSGAIELASLTLSESAHVIGNQPAEGAFLANVVTINTGSSISEGLQLLKTGGVINVNPGTYDEQLTFSKTCYLNGLEEPVISNLILDGAAVVVTLEGSVRISESLQLNRPAGGIIETSSFDLILSSTASVTPGNAISHVRTSGTGNLVIEGITAAATLFPVGTASGYAPVTIDDANNTGETIKVRIRQANNPNSFNPDLPEQVNRHINLEWTISESDAGGNNASVRFDYSGANEPSDWTTVQNRLVGRNQSNTWNIGAGITIGDGFSSATFTDLGGVFAVYSDFPNAIGSLETAGNFSVFPTPFNDQLFINANSKSTEQITVQLTDISGKLISSTTAVLSKGQNQIALNSFAQFSNGIYLLRLITSQGVLTTKVVKG